LFAGGFQVNLQGVKQTGMGHCGTAFTGDASVLFFNPAGASFLKNTFTFTGGISLITGTALYYNPQTDYAASTDNALATPIAVYGSYKISDRLAFGLSLTTPYGSALKWEDNWHGKYLVQEISLRTFFYQATISYKLGNHFSVGGALVYGKGQIKLQRDIPINGEENYRSYAQISGSDDAFGVNLGMLYNDSLWSVGVSYQSKMKFFVANGDAEFTVPKLVEDRFKNQQFSGGINTPDVLSIGVSRNVTQRLNFSAQYSYVGWSVYKALKIDFEENSSSLEDINELKNYRNTYILRVGASYGWGNNFVLRAGISYDRTPVDFNNYGPETPDSNRLSAHLGASIPLGKRGSLDLAYQFVDGKLVKAVHESGFGGYYKSRAHVLALGFSMGF